MDQPEDQLDALIRQSQSYRIVAATFKKLIDGSNSDYAFHAALSYRAALRAFPLLLTGVVIQDAPKVWPSGGAYNRLENMRSFLRSHNGVPKRQDEDPASHERATSAYSTAQDLVIRINETKVCAADFCSGKAATVIKASAALATLSQFRTPLRTPDEPSDQLAGNAICAFYHSIAAHLAPDRDFASAMDRQKSALNARADGQSVDEHDQIAFDLATNVTLADVCAQSADALLQSPLWPNDTVPQWWPSTWDQAAV